MNTNSSRLPFFSLTNILRFHATELEAIEVYDNYIESLNWSLFDGDDVNKLQTPMYGSVASTAIFSSSSNSFDLDDGSDFTDEWKEFFKIWYGEHGSNGITSRSVLATMLNHGLLKSITSREESAQLPAVRGALLWRLGVNFGGYSESYEKDTLTKCIRYKLTKKIVENPAQRDLESFIPVWNEVYHGSVTAAMLIGLAKSRGMLGSFTVGSPLSQLSRLRSVLFKRSGEVIAGFRVVADRNQTTNSMRFKLEKVPG